MADEYGVDRHAITDYAKELGIYIERSELLTEEQKQEIIDSYYESSASNLANKYGVSTSRISQIWWKAGLIGKTSRTYYLDEQYFSRIDSPDKAYFLGFIGSDGCIFYPKQKNKQNIVRITIQKGDIKVLELFKKVLNTDKPIYEDELYCSFEISSNKICEDLFNMGLEKRKTYGNTIAKISDDFMPHLIRGYFDGDGSITSDNDSISDVSVGISGFKKNMDTISEYLLGRNILSGFTCDKRNECDDPFGSLVLSNRMQKYCFLKLIYDNCGEFYMDRKYELAQKFINYVETSENNRDKQIVIYYKYAVCGVS